MWQEIERGRLKLTKVRRRNWKNEISIPHLSQGRVNVKEEPTLYVPAGMLPEVSLIPAAQKRQDEREREGLMCQSLIGLFQGTFPDNKLCVHMSVYGHRLYLP